MIFERKDPRLVTPSYEDNGIFKKEVIRITVNVIPQFGQNSRGDAIVKGFVTGDGAVDLIFPGRRKKHARKLQDLVQRKWSTACAQARARGETAQIEDFQCPVEVEGAWRARFRRDEQGMETRNHQLYAARWAYRDHDGMTVLSGEPIVR